MTPVMIARMKKELIMLQNSPPPGASCWQVENDKLGHLEAAILGPEDSSYEGGVFKIDILIPDRYPMEPPKVRFLTPIYHPNIDDGGRICLDILKPAPTGSWKPSINICSVLTSLQVLLSEPNPDDPLMPEISAQFRSNYGQFVATAKSWTNKHAGQDKENNGRGTKRTSEGEKVTLTNK